MFLKTKAARGLLRGQHLKDDAYVAFSIANDITVVLAYSSVKLK